MALLKTFSTLALVAGALLMLLPEGSLRKTAALVIGLLLMLCWAEGLMGMLSETLRPPSISPLLTPTDVSVDQAANEALQSLLPAPEVTAIP